MSPIDWSVTAADQDAFARSSGDVNPLHTDPLVARRLPFGRVAVHGMHLVVRALDQLLGEVDPARVPAGVKATFRAPVGIDDPLVTSMTDGSDDAVTVRVDNGEARAVDLTVELGEHAADPGELDPPRAIGDVEVRALDDLPGVSGAIDVSGDADELSRRFPAASRRLGVRAVAELLAMSRIVGMHAPGLHSLFSSVTVRRRPEPLTTHAVAYTVARVDDRFRLATIDVDGPNWQGRLQAFVRPEPVDVDVDRAVVSPGEFAGQRWLVVGGTRGLGAAATELLRAGGADVRPTYRVGRTDGAWQLEAAHPDAGLDAVTADGWQPTHLGWFATPPIFGGTTIDEFLGVYVAGFTAAVGRLGGSLVAALWPSSEAVETDVPGMAEYAAAKREGEARCAELAAKYGVRIVTPRWPRLLTDQTTSFVPVEFGDTTTEVLTALRATVGS